MSEAMAEALTEQGGFELRPRSNRIQVPCSYSIIWVTLLFITSPRIIIGARSEWRDPVQYRKENIIRANGLLRQLNTSRNTIFSLSCIIHCSKSILG